MIRQSNMFRKCCVVNCDSKRQDGSFHMFPKSETGLNKWLQAINCDRLRSLSFKEIRRRFVCLKHFEKKFFSNTLQRVRLCQNAYPTLFTATEIASGVPETASPEETETFNIDHDYYSRKKKHVDHTYCLTKFVEKYNETEDTEIKMEESSTYTEDTDLPSTSTNETEAITVNEIKMDERSTYTEDTDLPSTSTNETKAITVNDIQMDESSTNSDDTTLPSTFTNETEDISVNEKVLHSSNKIEQPRNMLQKKKKLAQSLKENSKYRSQLHLKKVRAKKALKLSREKYFQKLTKKLNPTARQFLWMQIKQCSKKARGRRFSYDDKMTAMEIMMQSPQFYTFLEKIFILPSKYTLNKMLSKSGINVPASTT